MRRWKNLGRVWMVAVFGFMYVPIAVLIAFSFNESKSRTVWAGFSLHWYKPVPQRNDAEERWAFRLAWPLPRRHRHRAGHAGGHRHQQHE
ncbi:MAG: hypothetical protein V8T36_01845 [Ruthenibacterium lactatiformans]